MRAVSGARVRRRLGYHHDHRRVGATGMVVLMEPGVGPPSNGPGQVTVTGPSVAASWSGRAPYTCFPSRRICQGRVLVA